MNVELVATCWTSAGNVAPLSGDETSPFDVQDRISEASRGGWSGLSLGQDDLRAIHRSTGFAALKKMISESSLTYVEVELLSGWHDQTALREGGAELRDFLFDAAVALDAKQVKIAVFGEPLTDVGSLAEPLRDLCVIAASRNIRLALEPMPFGLVSTMQQTATLLSLVDMPKTFGIFLDSWQFFRSGATVQELENLIDITDVFGVELSDARSTVRGTLLEDTINHRLPPGHGDFDLTGFITTLYRMGWRGPWGVEIMSDAHRQLPLVDALTVAHDAAAEVLNASLP